MTPDSPTPEAPKKKPLHPKVKVDPRADPSGVRWHPNNTGVRTKLKDDKRHVIVKAAQN